MKSKSIIISVSNDLCHDQRVAKVCESLNKQGYDVLLVGRKLNNSQPIVRDYKTHRIKLLFNQGFLFYAEFNFRLFFYLLFKKTHVYHSNDLDTLLANWLSAFLRRKKIVYDTHEYFTGVPEIQNKPIIKWFWQTIEKIIFPRLTHVFTVNESIANLYEKDYGVKPKIMRNIPSKKDIVKLNLYLTDLTHFPRVNEIMKEYFSAPYPARAAVGVSSLPKQSMFEGEAVMVLTKSV